jgi:hypothetical protein
MTSDRDKAHLGERLTGEHDPKDPDGLLTLDDVTPGTEPSTQSASSAESAPRAPGRHRATPRDDHNTPINTEE